MWVGIVPSAAIGAFIAIFRLKWLKTDVVERFRWGEEGLQVHLHSINLPICSNVEFYHPFASPLQDRAQRSQLKVYLPIQRCS